MELVVAGKLTDAGRAALEEEETSLATSLQVSLHDRNRKALPGRAKGNAVVTTHHLWWWTNGADVVKLPLQKVLKAEVHKSFFRKEPRIDLYFAQDPSEPLLRLVFGGNDCGEFFAQLENALSRERWKAPKVVVKRESGFNTQYAGVTGIMRRQQQARDQTDTLTNTAFSDLDELLTSASEIVKIADRFSSAIRQNKEKGTDQGKEEEDFYGLLNDMGIANPATKKACGSRYHEELARELSDFLSKHLKRHSKSGVMPLTDLYCLVNRARGTELISPNDLYQACTLMNQMNLAFHLKKFDSGVAVLQPATMSEEHITKQLLQLLEETDTEIEISPKYKSLTALRVAQALSISLPLALEHLKTAESQGQFCRDESLNGIAFYKNLFAQYQQSN